MPGQTMPGRTRTNKPHRTFLQRSYPTMKKHNPHTPILIREASGIEPTLYARYSASFPPPATRAPANAPRRLWPGEEGRAQGAGRQDD